MKTPNELEKHAANIKASLKAIHENAQPETMKMVFVLIDSLVEDIKERMVTCAPADFVDWQTAAQTLRKIKADTTPPTVKAETEKKPAFGYPV